jgi:hypothetical protein
MKQKILILLTVLASCTGMSEARDRALVIGVNYYQQAGIPRTEGAAEDALAIQNLLRTRFDFKQSSIVLLKNEEATTARIILELDRIVRETTFGDRVFVHYSGHGYQVPDEPVGDPRRDEKDELDEAITPYDVSASRVSGKRVKLELKADTYISDDTINSYIAKLTGRITVMFFDSCSSGTLSRALGSAAKKYSRYLRLEENSRSMSDGKGYSYVPANPGSRDLSIVKDQSLGDKNVNGAIIISAASAYQEAFPVKVGNVFRGGATYLFEQYLRSGNPTVRQIQENLVEGIKAAPFPREEDGSYQKPEIDVLSAVNLWDRPLFGAPIVNTDHQSPSNANYVTGLESALTNQYSKMKVSLSVEWSGKPEEHRNKPRFPGIFYLDDHMKYTVETSDDGYLYVFIFSANNVANCIFPAYVEKEGETVEADIENYLKRGSHHFPREAPEFPNVKEPYTPYAMKPKGTDVWVALLSKQKFSIDRQNYTWPEIFAKIGLTRLQEMVVARTRGGGNKSPVRLSDADWQSAIVVVETVD